MNHRIFILCATVAAGCSVGIPEDDPGCIAKCDSYDDDTWKYEAGQYAWFTCDNEAGLVTCRFERGPEAAMPTQVQFLSDDGVYLPGKLNEEHPEYRLPETFVAGDTLQSASRPEPNWAGDIFQELTIPEPGSSVTVYLPYDVWRVQVTKLISRRVRLAAEYTIALADVTFGVTNRNSIRYAFTAVMLDGDDPENLSATLLFPTWVGGRVSGAYEPGVAPAEPIFTLEQPGCYLADMDRLTWDEGCEETNRILGSAGTGA